MTRMRNKARTEGREDRAIPLPRAPNSSSISGYSGSGRLNDRLRTTGRGGMTLITNGIGALGLPSVNAIFAAIADFKDFNPDNDPWGEHACAALTVNGTRVIFKIDYLDRSRRIHSPDPADPKVTVRVMTVMLADEY